MMKNLSASDRKTINRIVKSRGGDKTRDAYYRAEMKDSKSTIDKYSGTSYYEVHLKNIMGDMERSLTEAEAYIIGDIYTRGIVERGVARRFTEDSPAELSCALSLDARFKRLHMLPPRSDPYVRAYDVWEIIQALASGDIDAALAMFPPKQRRLAVGHEPSVVAYNAVMGILQGNKRLLRAIDSELNYSSAPRPIRAVHTTLMGIAVGDADIVAAGLDEVLSTIRIFQLFGGCRLLDHELIVSFNAHGLAELAMWHSPKLLDSFDIDQPLPWDKQYFQSLRKANRSRKYLDLSKYSPLLTSWLAELREPEWWSNRQ
jgi:hypothetical protein